MGRRSRASASKSEDLLEVVGLQATFPASRLEEELVVLPAIILPFPARVPLVQRHIVVPYPVGIFTGELAETAPQGIKTINLL